MHHKQRKTEHDSRARRWEWAGSAPEILVSTLILPDSVHVKQILGAACSHHCHTGNAPWGFLCCSWNVGRRLVSKDLQLVRKNQCQYNVHAFTSVSSSGGPNQLHFSSRPAQRVQIYWQHHSPFPARLPCLSQPSPRGTRRDHSPSLAQQCSGAEAVEDLLLGCWSRGRFTQIILIPFPLSELQYSIRKCTQCPLAQDQSRRASRWACAGARRSPEQGFAVLCVGLSFDVAVEALCVQAGFQRLIEHSEQSLVKQGLLRAELSWRAEDKLSANHRTNFPLLHREPGWKEQSFLLSDPGYTLISFNS